MRRKNFLLAMVFIIIVCFICFQNVNCENEIISKTEDYSKESLRELTRLMNQYFELLERNIICMEIDELLEADGSDLSTINRDDVYKVLQNYRGEDAIGFSTYVYLDDGSFFWSNERDATLDSTFNETEKKEFLNLYEKVRTQLIPLKGNVIVGEENQCNSYIGVPIITNEGYFIGMKAIDAKEKIILNMIENFDEDMLKFNVSIVENNITVLETEDYSDIKIKSLAEGKVISTSEYMEKQKIKVIETANIYDFFKEFYVSRVVIFLILVLMIICLTYKLQDKKSYIDMPTICMLSIGMITMTLITSFNYINAMKRIEDARCYSFVYAFKLDEDLQKNFKTKFPEKLAGGMRIASSSVPMPDTMIADFIMSNFKRGMQMFIDTEKNGGHVYLYDVNRNLRMLPESEFKTYIKPNDAWFDYNEFLKNEKYYFRYYDENLKEEMCMLALPIPRNEKIVGVVAFVYDQSSIVNTLVSELVVNDLNKAFIDEDMKLYNITDHEMVYANKSVIGDKNFDSSVNAFENPKDAIMKVKYIGLEENIKKEAEYFCTDSYYLEGRITVYGSLKEENRVFVRTILMMALLLTVIDIVVIVFSKKEKEHEQSALSNSDGIEGLKLKTNINI